MSEIETNIPDQDVSVFKTPKGLNADIVREISKIKGEPEWMLEYRLKALDCFLNKPMPTWGVDLSRIDFDEYTYYIRPSDKQTNQWEEVPETIKNTFNKLGIPEAEQKYLSGVTTQYESEVVYHNMLKEVQEKGVIFLDIDSGLREYPEIFKKYFDTVIPYSDNKFSALNGAVWSGGSFIYIPPNTKLDRPLQSYFRIDTESLGQFERTIIIVDDNSELSYIEGCTAKSYSKSSLHAGVVEIFVGKNAKCRYSTIQNWSTDVYNLVTKRAIVDESGLMEWVDGNIGSKVTMKYPSVILKGDYSCGNCISIAYAKEGQVLDAGAKMIHLGAHTKSNIVNKSIASLGGVSNYRGTTRIASSAKNSRASVKCDTILLDNISKSDTFPKNIVENETSTLEHEASVSKVSAEKLFYLESKGLSEERAKELFIMGFIEDFKKELPMEYAVELNRLLQE